MSVSQAFAEDLKAMLAPLGAISVRRMFGGAGIYCDGLMFAILADDELYYKTIEQDRAAYTSAGSGPFDFVTKKGITVVTSYYRVPAPIIEDDEEMRIWARRALLAARQAAQDKGSKKPQPKRTSKRSVAPNAKKRPRQRARKSKST